jgi:hypothetical protein
MGVIPVYSYVSAGSIPIRKSDWAIHSQIPEADLPRTGRRKTLDFPERISVEIQFGLFVHEQSLLESVGQSADRHDAAMVIHPRASHPKNRAETGA